MRPASSSTAATAHRAHGVLRVLMIYHRRPAHQTIPLAPAYTSAQVCTYACQLGQAFRPLLTLPLLMLTMVAGDTPASVAWKAILERSKHAIRMQTPWL